MASSDHPMEQNMQTEAGKILNPSSLITEKTADSIVGQFGFKARKVRPGFFIAPVTRNRFGHSHVGDDAMYIGSNGQITIYNEDAQAFLAAKALSLAIKAEA
jgi:hypothetical protein